MTLLKILLEESEIDDSDVKPNQKDANGRTFLHILLNHRMIEEYEYIVKKYYDHLDLKIEDDHFNDLFVSFIILIPSQLLIIDDLLHF